jgi:hypothetical protein
VDLFYRSAAPCCGLRTNRPDASGRHKRPISVHHQQFIIHSSSFTLCKSLGPCEYSLPTVITEVQTVANPEHFRILKLGVNGWNSYRF